MVSSNIQVHEQCRDFVSFESYFICISNGEHGDLQSGPLIILIKSVPPLGGQLSGEGLMINSHFPEALSFR